MAGDILGFATKSNKSNPAAVLSSNGTQKNIDQIKKNAGQLADVVGSGADDSYKQFVSSQSKKQQQQKQAVEPAPQQPKQSTSLFSKVKSGAKEFASGATQGEQKFAQGIARVLPGGANDLRAEEKSSKADQQNLKTYSDLHKAGKLTDKQYQKATQTVANQSNQTSKTVKDTEKSMPTKAQIALGAASTAADTITAGELPEIKAAALGIKTRLAANVGAHLASNATAGGLNAAAAGGSKGDVIKNAAAGAVLPEVLHHGSQVVGRGVSAAAEKLGVGGKAAAKELVTNTQTKSLLDRVRQSQGAEPELHTEPTLPQPGEVITPTPQPELHPDTAKALQDTMATVHQPKAALEADAAKQAATEAAGKQSEQAAKDAEKATADTKKIDQQLEVYDAKAKDAKDGKLSNVDQVKVKQLKEQKAEVAQKLPQQSTNVLYHGTSADNALSILTDGKIKATAKPLDNRLSGGDKSLDDVRTVSLSRTAEGASQRGGNTADVHFIFDRDTLRNNAKLTPFSKRGFTKTELEERADRDIPISKATAVQVSGNVSPEQLAQIKAAAEKHGILVKTDADTPAKPIPEATPSVKPESTPAKPEVAKSASEASSAKDTPATQSEQKANTEPKVSNQKQTEIKATGPEPTVVPIKEPEIKQPDIGQSKLAASTEQKAIDKKLTAGFEGKPEYAKVNVKDQAKAALDLIKTDPERAKRIALGRELPPEHLLPESVYVAIEDHALKTKDVDLLRRLATEGSLSSEATGMGQRLRLLGERDPDSAVTAMRKLAETRKATVERKTGTTVAKATSEELKQIRSAKTVATPKVTRQTFAEFVDSIRC